MATYGGRSSSNSTRRVKLITSDSKEFKVPVEIARRFGLVREFFDGDLDRPEVENAAPFPLLDVESETLDRIVMFYESWGYFDWKFERLEKVRLIELPSKHQALEKERVLLPSKYQALEIEREFELPLKYQALEKERQEFKAEFFGRLSDETILKLVKAADYLETKELLDSVMPSFRKRFGLGDDMGVDFVYTAEAEALASASAGARS